MLELVCGIPGADPATVAWHASVHLGLAGFVTTVGSVLLVASARAYRRGPARRDPFPGRGPVTVLADAGRNV